MWEEAKTDRCCDGKIKSTTLKTNIAIGIININNWCTLYTLYRGIFMHLIALFAQTFLVFAAALILLCMRSLPYYACVEYSTDLTCMIAKSLRNVYQWLYDRFDTRKISEWGDRAPNSCDDQWHVSTIAAKEQLPLRTSRHSRSWEVMPSWCLS